VVHGRDVSHVPTIDAIVEGRCVAKERGHRGHPTDIPVIDLPVDLKGLCAVAAPQSDSLWQRLVIK
jgi:hypothetical protein